MFQGGTVFSLSVDESEHTDFVLVKNLELGIINAWHVPEPVDVDHNFGVFAK